MGFLNVEDLLFYPSEDFADGDLLVNGKHYDQPFSVDCTEGHRMGDTNCRIFEIYEDALAELLAEDPDNAYYQYLQTYHENA